MLRVAVVLAGLVFPLRAEAASTVSRTLEPGLLAQIVNGKNIYLLANAANPDQRRAAAEQVMTDPERFGRYARDPGLRVPLYRLTPAYRLAVTEALFPKDRPTRTGWRHHVTYADNSRDGGESLWRIAEWFTGRGANWQTIATYNGINGSRPLRVGDTVVIPDRLLRSAYRLDPAPQAQPPPGPVLQVPPRFTPPRRNGELTYHQDGQGPYARYKLKRGETLYTDVVVRFTDRVTSRSVLGAAREIARRSGIKNVKRIPNGQTIKIPRDLLSLEYRPPTDPGRQEYEQRQALARGYFNTARRRNLQGITIVLDAGHGGTDPGAIGPGRTYEDEVCYDTAVRAKRMLETETDARVVMLVEDRSQRFEPSSRTRFSNDKDEVVLTTPPYAMTDAKVGVNLRWYLANSVFRKALAAGAAPEEVLFTSFHADALHPAVHGAMVYIPGARHTAGSTGRSGRVYTRRAEVREAQWVKIPYRERIRMEGRSRNFARRYVNALRRHHIPVHADKPVRDVIYRGRRSKFVPGVIRQSLIPTKVLIELVNLKNVGDAKRIRDPEFRERLARAYVDAVIEYYDGEAPPAPRLVAAEPQP